MLLLPAAAWAQAKVVVLDTIQASLKLKLGVRQAVATALDDLSVPMIPLEDVLPEDASCTDATCYTAIAKRVGATHLLLVQGVANPAGYRLSLDVRDGESGRTLGTDGKDCELCAEDWLVPTVQEKVTGLWVRVMQEQSAAATPPPAPVVPSGMAPVTVTESAPPPRWYRAGHAAARCRFRRPRLGGSRVSASTTSCRTARWPRAARSTTSPSCCVTPANGGGA